MTMTATRAKAAATLYTRKSLLQPGWTYPIPSIPSQSVHQFHEIDHRDRGGPHLRYLWCQQDEQQAGTKENRDEKETKQVSGQTLYLGGEVGCDGNIYMVPGHAPRVMKVNTATDQVTVFGPELKGRFKWLRGIRRGDVIYGIPCHAEAVLRIHVPTGQVSTLPIPYEEFYGDNQTLAQQQRKQEWKYHGGTISPVDGCLYSIPQSALHVLKVDPRTETCTLVGPALPGRYKYYGGVVGKQDQAIYAIPHNASQVLRILPSAITLHGDLGDGGHKWHGASAASSGVIVSVPANADTVLCITPSHPEPILSQLTSPCIQTGRHRCDRKYKYLGATTGTDGHVYCFPSGSEQVLRVNTRTMTVQNVGPNIFDQQMERLCQNKWQNGVVLKDRQMVVAIPLAAESILLIDCVTDEVTTWPLPHPEKGLAKWEGAVVAPNGIIYCVPNNHKAVLRIDVPGRKASTLPERKPVDDADMDKAGIIYRSGIPTLRSSAHRVKFQPKNRKHDPKPRNRNGEESGTTWLPEQICRELVFDYDETQYKLKEALTRLLNNCDSNIVGEFRTGSDGRSLEDFIVPVPSTWRAVNGGQCEAAQKYLSDAVYDDNEFLATFDSFVQEFVLCHLKQRLVTVGAVDPEPGSVTFYYQRPPTIRLQPGPQWASVQAHDDAIYGHQNGELNFWVPFTDRVRTRVDLYCESEANKGDFHAIPAQPGQVISFHGSSCKHYVNYNESRYTRVSMDFRVGVEGFFDPYWQMKGTTDDHGRKEVRL